MFYSIRGGTDGLGLDFENVDGVFADSMDEARESAADKLRRRGYTLQADKGLFTVHGHRSWTLIHENGGFRIEPDDEPGMTVPSPTGSAIVTSDEPGTTITVRNIGTGRVIVGENMTFNNLQIGK